MRGLPPFTKSPTGRRNTQTRSWSCAYFTIDQVAIAWMAPVDGARTCSPAPSGQGPRPRRRMGGWSSVSFTTANPARDMAAATATGRSACTNLSR